jgi:hypothetical protein
MDRELMVLDNYFIVDAYGLVEPDYYARIWSNYWLQQYATVLIKERWGSVLKKFVGMQMPGGVQFNGKAIYDEAIEEKAMLKKELINTWSSPIPIFIG